MLAVPAGQAVRHEVVEDSPRVDNLAEQIKWPAVGAKGDTVSVAAAAGINIKVATMSGEPKLVGLRIDKGMITRMYQVQETKAYFVQNLSDLDRTFTVDHVVRPGWARLDDKGDPQAGPEVFRFKSDRVGTPGHARLGIRLGPVADPQAFARKIPFGTTTVKGRKITVAGVRAEDLGLPRREVYRRALALRGTCPGQ